MKTKLFTIALITIATTFIACNPSTKKKNETNVVVKTDTIVQGVEEPEPVKPVDYNEYRIAYVKTDGKLYFFNPEDKSIVQFREEPDSVFNCVYSDMDDRFFYSTYQNGKLTIKGLDLSNKPIQISKLTVLEKTKEELLTQTNYEKALLKFIKNHLLLEHDFIWDYYSYTKFIEYSLTDNTTQIINWRQFERKYKYHPCAGIEPTEDYTSIYKKTEQMDLTKYECDDETAVDKQYIFENSSYDDKKILFAIMLCFGDLGHGVYCVANSDGTMLKLLEDTDITPQFIPAWSNHNLFFLRSREDKTKGEYGYITEFFYTLAETNETVYIDKDVDYFAVRKKHPVNQ